MTYVFFFSCNDPLCRLSCGLITVGHEACNFGYETDGSFRKGKELIRAIDIRGTMTFTEKSRWKQEGAFITVFCALR